MSLAATSTKASYRPERVAANKNSSYAILVIVIAAFTLACVPLAYYLNIWQDEAYSLHSSSGNLIDALRQGLGFEAQAPLYFVALAAWRGINDSATFARLLSVAFSIVTLFATWLFARSYITRINPGFVVAAVALNPFVVWAAVEIRPYAASLAFSALLLLCLFRGFVDDDACISSRIWYIVVAIAGTYTQYYVAFLIPAHLVALLVLQRWKSVRRFIVYVAAFVVTLVPLAHVLPAQFQSYHAFAVAYKVPSYVMATVLLGYPFPHGWVESWAHARLENAAYALVVLVPLALAFGRLGQLSVVTKALLAIVATLFATYSAAIGIAHVHVLVPRHTLVMLVPMLAACFALVGDVTPLRRKTVLASYLAIYCSFASLSLWHDFHKMAKTGDWHRVADFIAGRARAGDGIAIFDAEGELPFRYYYKHASAIAAIPQAMAFDRFDEERFVLHSQSDVARTLTPFSVRHERIWLIETDACAPRYAFFGCAYLNSYVSTNFQILDSSQFVGTRVIELQRRPTAGG